MRNRPGHLDGEPEIDRRAIAPLRVRRRGVRPVKRRVDLCATQPARVALEMRSSRIKSKCRRARIDQPAVPIRMSAVLPTDALNGGTLTTGPTTRQAIAP